MLLVAPAFALTLRIEAAVRPGLDGVDGELWADGPVALVDPLATVPDPPDDRSLLRTFPRHPDAGELRWEELEPGHWRFTTRLPVRYGDVGALPGRGLWANGAWYPQPVDATGRPAVATWTVHVTAPELTVINGSVGDAWSGTADRVALAVIPDAVQTRIGPELVLVEHRRSRRHLRRQLEPLAASWPDALGPVTVVEDRDLLRLARAAPGMVFLSDRAFRVSPGLNAFHREPVWRALVSAGWPAPDAWTRDFAGAAFGDAPDAKSVARSFSWLAWNPVVDSILHDGTTPFYTDLFDEAFPQYPSALDVLDTRMPGRAAAQQLDALQGEGTAAKVLRTGDRSGVPPEILLGWERPYRANQDYVAARGEVRRDAPTDAPAEVVVIEQGGKKTPWIASPGERLPTSGPARIDAKVDQTEISNDSWPPRWNLVASAGVDGINPTQGSFSAWGELYLRKQGDTRNVYYGLIEHDDQDLAGVRIGYVRYLGALLDRRLRQHRLSFVVGPSLLDPAFRPTDNGAVAVGGSVQYDWNTKGTSDTAVSGFRFSVGAGGGFVPNSSEVWAATYASHAQLIPLSLRDVIGVRVKAGWASGDVEHRLLTLGGSGDLRAVPVNEALSNERVEATIEYRWTPVRHASVPLPLLWLSEVRVVPGVEVGAGWRGDQRFAAVGADLGLYWIADNLGALPSLLGVSFGYPLWSEGYDPQGLQFYIDFEHRF